jgi:tetratricopeptide (TPR) repeat protein
VPDTTTRGRARARFIREHAADKHLVVDWGTVTDSRNNRRCRLPEPFAQNYEPWEDVSADFPRTGCGARRDLVCESQILQQVQQAYERGAYETAHRHLAFLEAHGRRLAETSERITMVRYRAWIQSRRGHTDGVEFLNAIHGGHPVTAACVADYLVAYRFRSLDLPPEIQPWLEHARGLLRQADAEREGPSDGLALREHLAYASIRQGRLQEAVALLEPLWRQADSASEDPRTQGRLLATLGDAYRLLGRSRRALTCLRRAEQLLDPQQFLGERADFAWTGQAKLAQNRQQVLGWLAAAKEAQTSLRNGIGLTRTLLLEARRSGDPVRAAANRDHIAGLRAEIPALGTCCLLGRILEHWDQWTSEDGGGDLSDTYWGL